MLMLIFWFGTSLISKENFLCSYSAKYNDIKFKHKNRTPCLL